MKLNFIGTKNGARLEEWRKSFFELLEKRTSWLLLLIFLAMAGYSCYLWYFYIYNSQWSLSQKEEYVKSKDKEIIFDKAGFNRLVAKFEERKNDYSRDLGGLTDIFRVKK